MVSNFAGTLEARLPGAVAQAKPRRIVIMTTRLSRLVSCLLLALGLAGIRPTLAAPFTPGNIVVAVVGDGTGTLSAAAAPVFLVEYTPTGTLVQTVALPATTSGTSHALTASGSATSELNLTRSGDGRYLVLTGYDATVGTTGVASTTVATVSRVVGRVAADGTVNTTTLVTDAFNGNNIRAAYSPDGTVFYAVGGSSGVNYVTLGNTGASVNIAAAPANIRAINSFGGNLYVSSGSTATLGISQIGTGLPTTTGQTNTILTGLATATGSSPYAFYFADLSTAVAGVDVAYVVDDRTATGGGIQKYSLVGGTWMLNGTIASAATTVPAVRGLTGSVSGTTVTLLATATTGLYNVTDATGYNVAPTAALPTTPLVAAGTNTVFRGVALAPVAPAAATVTATPVGPLTFTTTTNAASAAQTVTINGSSLTAALTATASAGYEVATSATGPYSASVTLPPAGGTVAATAVYVRLASTATAGTLNGALTIASTGATSQTITLNGTVVAPTPTVTVTPTSAITFNSTTGNASAATPLTVSGSNLTAALTVTTTTGYEVSLTSTGPFSTSLSFAPTNGSVAATTVYVRLAASNTTTPVGGTLTVASAGAASQTIALTATVVAPTTPSISVTPAGPLTFSTLLNTPSATQQVTVSGTSLTGVITVSASTGYEVSLTATGTFSSSVTLTPTNGTVAATAVYVRLASASTAGTVNGTLTASSNMAILQTVTLNGTVLSPTLTASTGGPLTFTTPVNTASAAQTLTVSGTNLVAPLLATASAGYEVSLTAAGPYSSSVTLTPTNNAVAATTLYVRLASTATAGTVNGTLTMSTTGGGSQNITLLGTVVAPTVTATPAGPLTFTTTAGVASSAQTVTVSGSNLTATTLTATASAGYEVATSATGPYSASVSFTPASGTVATTTLYVRLASTTTVGTVNGTLTIASTGATSRVIILNGTVAAAAPTITSLTPATQPAGGPAVTLTVQGTGFLAGTVVNFRGVAYTPTSLTATSLVVTLPASALTVMGTYQVTVINAAGISNSLPFVVTMGLATLPGATSVELAVYPNPAHSVLTVRLSGIAAPNALVELFDLTGRMVRTTSLPATGEVSVAGLPTGVYVLRVAGLSQRLMVQ